MHILFVCTGNVCRSPTAERLAIASAVRSRIDDLHVSSAGTHALTERPMEPHAAQVLETLGGNSSDFAAQQLTRTMVADADLILTMTRAHRDDVLALAPHQLHRTFTLEEAARLVTECEARNIPDLAAFRPSLSRRGSLDIPDPMGRDESVFATVGARIAELVPPILEVCRSD